MVSIERERASFTHLGATPQGVPFGDTPDQMEFVFAFNKLLHVLLKKLICL